MPNRDTAATLEYHEATGTGGAVHLARSLVHGPVLILFADSLFDSWQQFLDEQKDADDAKDYVEPAAAALARPRCRRSCLAPKTSSR